MLSSILAALLATASANAVQDATTASRNAYTSCLRAFMQRSLTERTALTAFEAALPQQCTAQEQAYRRALVARDSATGAARAQAEEDATLEIQDARENFKQLFEMNVTPA